MRRGSFGAYGEAVAGRYLSSEGYRLLARRWRIRHGEIDLVAEKGDEVVFVEVKSRRTGTYGPPEEAVTAAKAARLRAAAYAWLATHAPDRTRFRIDVIAVRKDEDGGLRVRHIRNAVGAD